MRRDAFYEILRLEEEMWKIVNSRQNICKKIVYKSIFYEHFSGKKLREKKTADETLNFWYWCDDDDNEWKYY